MKWSKTKNQVLHCGVIIKNFEIFGAIQLQKTELKTFEDVGYIKNEIVDDAHNLTLL
jgi:hypothetical protein